MNESLTQAINDMRTMREVYNDLQQTNEVFSPELQAGKAALATAITDKGVTTAASDTLATMAENVSQIAQSPIEVDGGEMYAKQLFGSLNTPNYWNLYDVMTALLNTTNASDYGGILLGEYYKGYASLAFGGSGAPSAGTGGGYVFSDDVELYTENGELKLRAKAGKTLIHTIDETHYWDDDLDGKGNRWVAWLFAGASHGFAIASTDTCPRSIHIGRHVGVIDCSANTRISKIVVTDGNVLDDFVTRTTALTHNFAKDFVLRNVKNIGTYCLLGNTGNIETAYIQAEEISTAVIFNGTHSYLTSIIFDCPYIHTYGGNAGSGGGLFVGQFSLLKDVIIKCERGSFALMRGDSEAGQSIPANTHIYFMDAEEIGASLRTNAGSAMVYVGYKNNDKSRLVSISIRVAVSCELQDGWCKPLTISSMTNLTKAGVQSGIFDKLGVNDISTGTVTITLASAVLALFTEEEIDAVVERTNITIVGA